jgi:hypothetical protein
VPQPPGSRARGFISAAPEKACHGSFDASFERFAAMLDADVFDEAHARRFTQGFVLLVQAGLLLRAAKSPAAGAVADAFCASRLSAAPGWGAVFGGAGAIGEVGAVLNRAWMQ